MARKSREEQRDILRLRLARLEQSSGFGPSERNRIRMALGRELERLK